MILIVSIPDICVLPYFLDLHEYRLTRNTVYCAILSDQIVVGCPLGVPISYSIVYACYIDKCSSWANWPFSPVENQNDLELDFKVFFFVDSCC